MKKEKNIILGIISASHLVAHAQMIVFPTILLSIHKEFGLGMDQLGIMVAISSFMFGLGAIPAGFYENKLGGKNLLLIYQIGSGCACIFLALARTPFQISLGLAMLGLSSSIYHPAGLTILSRKLEKLSGGLAIHGIAGSLGLALGPFLAALFTEFGSWRYVYLIWAIIQFSLLLFTISSVTTSAKNILNHSTNFPKNKVQSSLVLYYTMAICMGFAFSGFSAFMPTLFAMQTKGVFQYFPETLKAGIFTTLVFGFGIIGQTFGGILGDRYDRISLLIWIVFLSIPFLFIMGYFSGWPLFIFSIILAIIYFSNQPISNALLADLTPNSKRGLGYGISFFLGFGIGGLAPALCGIITEKYYLELVFPVMSFCLIPGLISVWILKKRVNYNP